MYANRYNFKSRKFNEICFFIFAYSPIFFFRKSMDLKSAEEFSNPARFRPSNLTCPPVNLNPPPPPAPSAPPPSQQEIEDKRKKDARIALLRAIENCEKVPFADFLKSVFKVLIPYPEFLPIVQQHLSICYSPPRKDDVRASSSLFH